MIFTTKKFCSCLSEKKVVYINSFFCLCKKKSNHQNIVGERIDETEHLPCKHTLRDHSIVLDVRSGGLVLRRLDVS